MKWAVVGASGQLGNELSKLFLSFGYENICWPSDELDITTNSAIESIVNEAPDVLINCAAWTNVEGAESKTEQAFKVNQLGAANMASAAKILKVPFVHISTDYVFAGTGQTPWRITDPTEPASAYGRSKLAGETEVRAIYPEGSYIFRTAWLYSQFGSNFPKSIMKRILRSKEELKVVEDQKGQPTSARELASLIIKVIERGAPVGIYHATNSGMASWFEFAQHILIAMDEPKWRITPIPTSAYLSSVRRPSFSVLEPSDWSSLNLTPMQDWQTAFNLAFPAILDSVKAELSNG